MAGMAKQTINKTTQPTNPVNSGFLGANIGKNNNGDNNER
jgi:hypothetical protein